MIVFSNLKAAAGTLRVGKVAPGTADAEDHALVPSDVMYGGSYFRDLEIAVFLHVMVENKLVVTVVLDCCHSSGAVRGVTNRYGASRTYTVRIPPSIRPPIWTRSRSFFDALISKPVGTCKRSSNSRLLIVCQQEL